MDRSDAACPVSSAERVRPPEGASPSGEVVTPGGHSRLETCGGVAGYHDPNGQANPASAGLPGGAGRPVLEHDALLPQPGADGVGFLEVPPPAGLVARLDGGPDLSLAQAGSLPSPCPYFGKQGRGRG